VEKDATEFIPGWQGWGCGNREVNTLGAKATLSAKSPQKNEKFLYF